MYTDYLGLHCTRSRTSTVTRNMRMRINLAWLHVCCPASVSNITGSFQCLTTICFLNQIRQTNFCFHDLCQTHAPEYGQYRSVLQQPWPPLPVQQDHSVRLSYRSQGHSPTPADRFSTCRQFTHRFLLRQHHFHHLQTGQDTIASGYILREDDMTALLTTNAAAVFNHVFIDIFVAHSDLSVTDTLLIKYFIQTKVGHDHSNSSLPRSFI